MMIGKIKMLKKPKIYTFLIRTIIIGLIYVWPAVNSSDYLAQHRDSDRKKLNRYDPLISSLAQQEDISRQELEFIFLDPRVEFYQHLVVDKYTPPAMHKSSSVYFHKNLAQHGTEDFIAHYHSYLKKAEEQYGVEKEAVAAVIFVETKFGRLTGRYSVFNVLSSLALADSPISQTYIADHIHRKYHHFTYERRQQLIRHFQNNASQKSKMARSELAYLIRLQLESSIDILELPGSYAGAFGYPQFMPSSVYKYGVDGDRNGRVDLFTFPDAIMSVGKYLHAKGWDSDHNNKKRALLRYNYSNRYVADVLAAAAEINRQFN